MRDALIHRQEREEREGQPEEKSFVFKFLSPETIWAVLLFLIVVALIVFTTDDSPVWIYQGF